MQRTSRDLAGRLGDRLGGARQHLAAAVAGDEVRAEVARLRGAVTDLDARTDELGRAVGQRLDALTDVVGSAADDLGERIDRQGRSWIRRLLWLLLGAAAGAATAALADPARGARRRRELRDRARARARDLAEGIRTRARYASGVAQGVVVETAREAVAPRGPAPDPETLRQRIRSEVVGHVDGAEDIVVAVHSGGRVALKGAVSSADAERRLVEATRGVPGVEHVTSELTVRVP